MKFDKKSVITISSIVGGGILFYWALTNFDVVGKLFTTLWGLVFPFVLGLIIAFLLNIPMCAIENLIFKERRPRYRRVVSLVLTILAVLLVLALVIGIVIPQLVNTVSKLAKSMPEYLERMQKALKPYADKWPDLQQYFDKMDINWKELFNKLFSFIGSGAGNVLSSTINVATSIISGITSLSIGIIFGVYLLLDKEHLSAQLSGLLQAYMPKKAYAKLTELATLTHHTFSRFVAGQCAEAVLLGVMFMIVLTIGRFDYSLLISVLIGFMALIPILGAFIGCIIGAFLILVSSGFWRMLAFIIIFLLVQSFDGNVTYPRIVGSSIGLPPVWVLAAVTVGGSLMGIFGMLFFIPFTSVVYTLVRQNSLQRLEEKDIPSPVDAWREENPPKPKRQFFKRFRKKKKDSDDNDA